MPIGAIGRTLEAKFQWAHARDLKPDPEDLPKIEAKIKNGLPDEQLIAAKASKPSGQQHRKFGRGSDKSKKTGDGG